MPNVYIDEVPAIITLTKTTDSTMHTYTMEQWKDITTHDQQDYNLIIS